MRNAQATPHTLPNRAPPISHHLSHQHKKDRQYTAVLASSPSNATSTRDHSGKQVKKPQKHTPRQDRKRHTPPDTAATKALPLPLLYAPFSLHMHATCAAPHSTQRLLQPAKDQKSIGAASTPRTRATTFPHPRENLHIEKTYREEKNVPQSNTEPIWVNNTNAALFTDLFELTMMASYVQNELLQPATLDLFVRQLPPHRSFLLSCGLHTALDYFEHLQFDPPMIDWLRSLNIFEENFLSHLQQLRFIGDVWASPEGEIVFPNEPILWITAPLPEAQLVQTFLLNCLGYQTMVASKAARISLACGDRPFSKFGAHRCHGTDAAMKAARAAYIGGASGTSNMLAARAYDIPPVGTMSHAHIMRFGDKLTAHRAFTRDFPQGSTLLFDTYDTMKGAQLATQVAKELAAQHAELKAVRLDSGDIAKLAPAVRRILDEASLHNTQIFVSGDIDEKRIASLLQSGTPIDAFGIGTQPGTSGDAPNLGVVHKLAEDITGPKSKLSPEKTTLPACKQVYRVEQEGKIIQDAIALHSEQAPAKGRSPPRVRHAQRTSKQHTKNTRNHSHPLPPGNLHPPFPSTPTLPQRPHSTTPGQALPQPQGPHRTDDTPQ